MTADLDLEPAPPGSEADYHARVLRERNALLLACRSLLAALDEMRPTTALAIAAVESARVAVAAAEGG